VLAAARERTSVVRATYMLCGIMEVVLGHLRGRGCSVIPMISSLVCSCLLRMLWVWFVFPCNPTSLAFLFLCYPLSWILTILCHFVTAAILTRREKKKLLMQ
jgi:Na+-driven multidrug efflux pump